MQAQGFYLYCFARAGAGRNVEVAGVDGRAEVTSLELDDVAAVFSHVWLDEFRGGSAESRVQDPAWVVPRACQHKRVLEEVMKSSAVLPVRLGTVFTSRRALAEILSDNEQEISRCLDALSDKEEWSVIPKPFALSQVRDAIELATRDS